ncbi:hypothetical protein C8Q73DRAFT_699186 [Cubamyces lactineus]|nr:hypothetical protein C8Q73DRAFT_699186 [Cubamyces lactineus]
MWPAPSHPTTSSEHNSLPSPITAFAAPAPNMAWRHGSPSNSRFHLRVAFDTTRSRGPCITKLPTGRVPRLLRVANEVRLLGAHVVPQVTVAGHHTSHSPAIRDSHPPWASLPDTSYSVHWRPSHHLSCLPRVPLGSSHRLTPAAAFHCAHFGPRQAGISPFSALHCPLPPPNGHRFWSRPLACPSHSPGWIVLTLQYFTFPQGGRERGRKGGRGRAHLFHIAPCLAQEMVVVRGREPPHSGQLRR